MISNRRRRQRFKNKKFRQLFNRDRGICQICGCRVFRVATVQKYRQIIKQELGYLYYQICDNILLKVKVASIGHIADKEFGGTYNINNIQLECWQCNNEKAHIKHITKSTDL